MESDANDSICQCISTTICICLPIWLPSEYKRKCLANWPMNPIWNRKVTCQCHIKLPLIKTNNLQKKTSFFLYKMQGFSMEQNSKVEVGKMDEKPVQSLLRSFIESDQPLSSPPCWFAKSLKKLFHWMTKTKWNLIIKNIEIDKFTDKECKCQTG